MAGDKSEPSLDGIMAQMMEGGFFGGEGWEGINNAGQAMGKTRDDMRSEFEKEAEIIRATFKTEAGQKCLELFLDQTLRRSAWPAEMNYSMDVLTPLGIYREGQNGFVASILAAYATPDDESKIKQREKS